MTYKLITGTTETLAGKVNEYLHDGWTLFGSPFATGAYINLVKSDATTSQVLSQDPEIGQAIYTG